jgi:hypothetical protein
MNGPMMNSPQSHVDIPGYLLGMLDPAEARWSEDHLARCEVCHAEVVSLRQVEDALDDIPPELFYDGPDPEADLLLQRTLRSARAETATRRWGRVMATSAAAVVVLALAIGGGFLFGRNGQSTAPPQALPTPSASAAPVGTVTKTAVDSTTGAKLTATVEPAAGWVRVHALVENVKEGERCRLIVTDKQGNNETAGSWVIGHNAAISGLPVDGDALIDPDDVKSVKVVTVEGNHELVSVDF